jgi:hypothetical protein
MMEKRIVLQHHNQRFNVTVRSTVELLKAVKRCFLEVNPEQIIGLKDHKGVYSPLEFSVLRNDHHYELCLRPENTLPPLVTLETTPPDAVNTYHKVHKRKGYKTEEE